MPPKWLRTEPVASSNLVSQIMRDNMQAIGHKLLDASARAQSSPDMTVQVADLVFVGSDGKTRKSYAGGNSPAITAPSTNPRISLLTLDDASTLAWLNGTEAASPAAPDYPVNKIVICEVFARTTMTSIKDSDDGTHGYIQRQGSAIRPGVTFLHGQCLLAKSGANLVLSPYNGNKLMINSRVEEVPDAGVSLAIGAAAANTTYYIYAFMSSGTMTLEFSATGYATQAATGIKIKSGDATRTLVGIARTTAAPAWADTAAQRYVRSLFNRQPQTGLGRFSTSPTTGSATFVELATEIRVEFVCFADDVVVATIAGQTSNNTNNHGTRSGIAFDGGTTEEPITFGYDSVATTGMNFSTTVHKDGLADGYHYATLMGRVHTANTGTWVGGGALSATALALSIQR